MPEHLSTPSRIDSKQALRNALRESMRINGDPTRAARDLGVRGPRLAQKPHRKEIHGR
jgi:hypothetical protein